MTGRYPIRTGLWKGNLKPDEEFGLELNETLLPEMLQRNGYSTHGVGKWHCGMYTWNHTPAQRGYDTFFGLYMGEQNYFSHKNIGLLDLRNNYYDKEGIFVDYLRQDLDGYYNTRLFTDESVNIIQNHDKIQPLFLYLAYTAPHIPYQAPKEDIERFGGHISGERKVYASMVSIMDEGIGKVVGSLKKRGMMENTILVFTSDNGAYYHGSGSNFPLRGGKSSYLEGGVRGLAFVNSPLLQKTGYVNTNLHHITDWYATFQMLAGDEAGQHKKAQLPLDGVNIWPSISQNEVCREEVLLGLRDPSLRFDNRGLRGLHNLNKFEGRNLTSEVIFIGSNSRYAQDFFVVRWKNWKLLTGTSVEIQGWSSENRTAEYRQFADSSTGKMYSRSVMAGTLLFDLSTDEREENNVADMFPDIVRQLLGKKSGYRDKLVPVYESNYSNAGKVHRIWKPWVEL